MNELLGREESSRIEFKVHGPLALFTEPGFRMGGEKASYMVPTYEAIKGITASIYWKPTFIWHIDKVRVMKPIKMQPIGVRNVMYNPTDRKVDLSVYSYLEDVEYQVQAHFEWNYNRENMAQDRNWMKHKEIARRSIETGGRRDIFLGTRECQGYVEPCKFGEGEGYYDNISLIDFGFMFHGFTYPDEQESNLKLANFWNAKMEKGVITFPRPENCPKHKALNTYKPKVFVDKREED